MPASEPARLSHHTRVTQLLGRRIVNGAYGCGELLPHETKLIDNLDVSRTVLREAMRTLSAKGMVVPKQRVGTRVADRGHWNLLDPEVLGWHVDEAVHHPDLYRQIVEARLVIEPVAAGMAAQRAAPEAAARIKSALRSMEEAGDDLPAYLEADISFHQSIYEAAGNELLGQMGNVLLTALHLSQTVTSQVPDAINRSLPLHVAVGRAIGRGSSPEARRAMDAVVRCTIDDLEATLGCRLNVGNI